MIKQMMRMMTQEETPNIAFPISNPEQLILMESKLGPDNRKHFTVTTMSVPEYNSVAQNLKQFLIAELDRRFNKIEHNMICATAPLLDPRFMKHYFRQPLGVSNALTLMEKEMLKNWKKEANESCSNENKKPADDPTINSTENFWGTL
ncbi:uncharacterized protein Dwil_GK23405 [Drosophila willistoni]|uniref:Uncharacterized protein n=1 Tax=Drosophila willistoni TaxID=7260 RepID=A0A0Q9WVW8_DROWI|nr:uncharacterized protein Dwil_GK23405 [Drosophila willistoni]